MLRSEVSHMQARNLEGPWQDVRIACSMLALVLTAACGGAPSSPSTGDEGSGTPPPAAGPSGNGGGGAGASAGGGGTQGSGTGTGAGGGGAGGGAAGGSGAGGGGATGGGGEDAGSSHDAGMPAGTVAISDGFTGPNNQTIAGMGADTTNLPAGAWSVDAVNTSGSFEAFIDTGDGNPAPSLHLYDVGGSTGSAAIPILSQGTYVKPVKFSIRVDIKELNPGMILLVGFYGRLPAPGQPSVTGFNGLGYHTDTGDLDLVEDGATKTTLPFTGSFQTGGFNTLGYSIDTSTGAISGVSLTGNKGSYAFSSAAFTDAATEYIVFGTAPGGAAGACQYFDNLTMTAE
jgi:hypothetical protein